MCIHTAEKIKLNLQVVHLDRSIADEQLRTTLPRLRLIPLDALARCRGDAFVAPSHPQMVFPPAAGQPSPA